MRSGFRRSTLHEKIEHMREIVCGNSYSVVQHAHGRAIGTMLDADEDASMAPTKLGGVIDEVYEYLDQANRVRLHVNLACGHLQDHLVTARKDEVTRALDCLPHYGDQIDAFRAHLELAGGDPGHVLEVLDQSQDPAQLRPDKCLRLLDAAKIVWASVENVHSAPNYGERISQLVGKHSQRFS